MFVSLNINANSNTKGLLFNHFVDILENLNDLRHDHNLFNYFFQDIWHLNQPLFVSNDFNRNIDNPVNNLEDFLDMVDISDSFFEFLEDNCFFNNPFNFLNRLILISHLNNLFVFFNDLFDSLHNYWDFYYLLNNVLYVSVDIDELRNNPFNLNNLWNFNNLLFDSFDFVDLGDDNCFFNDLFHNLLGSHDFSDNIMNWDDLLDEFFDLLDFSSNIRNFLDDFLYFSVGDNFFFNLDNFNRLRFDGVLNNNFFHDSGNLNNLLDSFLHRNKFFNYSVNRNRYFDRNDNLFLDLHHTRHFNLTVNDLFHRNVSGDFLDNFDDSFNNYLLRNDSFLNIPELNDLVDNLFNNSVNFDVDVLLNNDFLNSVLDNRNLNNSFHLFDPFLNNDFGDNSLDNLGYFHNFFNHSGNNDHLFNNLFNFNDFGNFNHFLNDFLNWNLDLFDSINMSQHLHYLFFNIFDGFGNFDVVIDDFLHFNCLRLFNNDGISDFHNNGYLSFNGLNNGLFDNYFDLDYSLVNDRHLHNSFDLLRNFFDHLNSLSNNFLNLFDSVNSYYLFNNNLNFFWNFNSVGHSDNFLDNLRYLHNSFLSLDNDNRFFNNSVDNLISYFDMVFNFLSCYHIYFFDNFLNNLFDLDDFGYLHDFFHNFFDIDRHFNNFLYNFFNSDYLLFVNLDLFDFSLDVVDDLLNSDRSIDFNNLLNNLLDSLKLGNLLNDFNDSVLDGGNFHWFLDDSLDMNNLVLDRIDNDWYLNRNWNLFLNFPNFLNFDYFFHNFFDSYNLRNLHDTVNNFFNNFFNFDNFRDNSEDLQDVVNVDNSHDFLVDHANDTFVNLKSGSSSSFKLF